jgi:hypothetical protein
VLAYKTRAMKMKQRKTMRVIFDADVLGLFALLAAVSAVTPGPCHAQTAAGSSIAFQAVARSSFSWISRTAISNARRPAGGN